jgi:hypothetical protein
MRIPPAGNLKDRPPISSRAAGVAYSRIGAQLIAGRLWPQSSGEEKRKRQSSAVAHRGNFAAFL